MPPARSLPPCHRHTRLTECARLLPITKRRGSWRSHVHRTRLRSACSHSSYKLPMSGVEEGLPSPFSGGFKGGILFGKRIPPLLLPPAGSIFPRAKCARFFYFLSSDARYVSFSFRNVAFRITLTTSAIGNASHTSSSRPVSDSRYAAGSRTTIWRQTELISA